MAMTTKEDGEKNLLEIGTDIKPDCSEEDVNIILTTLFGLEKCTIKELDGYDDKNYFVSPKINKNPNIGSIWPHGYVMKVTNSLDSSLPGMISAQNDIMLHLSKYRPIIASVKFHLFLNSIPL